MVRKNDAKLTDVCIKDETLLGTETNTASCKSMFLCTGTAFAEKVADTVIEAPSNTDELHFKMADEGGYGKATTETWTAVDSEGHPTVEETS